MSSAAASDRSATDRPWLPAKPKQLVGIIVIFALAIRLFSLGTRTFHQDEARVAYWTLQALDHGAWSYNPHLHGPFLHHVNTVVFSTIGASDFSARLIVAVIGGCLPLAALTFRDRLDDVEILALAVFLAATPVLVYYSRFMRNDLPLAGAMLLVVGLIVRVRSSHLPRYFIAAVVVFTLGVTMKENALVYPIAWLGAGLLVFDHQLFGLAGTDQASRDSLSAAVRRAILHKYRSAKQWITTWFAPVLVSGIFSVIIFVFAYAPRSGRLGGPGIGDIMADPAAITTITKIAFGDFATGTFDRWVGIEGLSGGETLQIGSTLDHPYLPYLGDLIATLYHGALIVLLLAVIGFLAERYRERDPRPIVSFAFYWGVLSIIGYPIIMDIQAPWAAIHVVLPLAIPAAVGAREIIDLLESGPTDWSLIFIIVIMLGVVGFQMGVVTAETSFLAPQSASNPLAQYAQPADRLEPTIQRIETIAENNDAGPDVVFYGQDFHIPHEQYPQQPPGGEGWFNRLPLPWYLERAGVEVTSTESPSTIHNDPPPVVIALGETAPDATQTAGDIAPGLEGYDRVEKQLYLWDRPIVFLIDRSAG